MAALTPLSTVPPVGLDRPAAADRNANLTRRFNEVLAQPTRPPVDGKAVAGGPPSPGLTQGVVDRMAAGQAKLDQIIARAKAGHSFSPRELLAMQIDVYRVTEELSLVNKVVEQGMAGLKRLWNLQV